VADSRWCHQRTPLTRDANDNIAVMQGAVIVLSNPTRWTASYNCWAASGGYALHRPGKEVDGRLPLTFFSGPGQVRSGPGKSGGAGMAHCPLQQVWSGGVAPARSVREPPSALQKQILAMLGMTPALYSGQPAQHSQLIRPRLPSTCGTYVQTRW